MTRKQKPLTVHKKRPAEKPTKPVKSVATDKAVAAVASLREKERGKVAPAAKKGAPAAKAVPAPAHGKAAEAPRAAGGKAAATSVRSASSGACRRCPRIASRS